MAVRLIVTDASVWAFDFTDMVFRRDPRVEGTPSMVRYAGEWRPFDSLSEGSFDGGDQTRIRFTVYGRNLDGMGSEWITSTYRPHEQGAAL